MKAIRYIRRSASVVAALASSLLGFLFFSPSAFALVVRPVGDGSSSAGAPPTASSTTHNIVAGGMAGWQITLIAIAAALMAATVAVLMDRARTAHRNLRVSAA
jgi:hypothetical protein